MPRRQSVVLSVLHSDDIQFASGPAYVDVKQVLSPAIRRRPETMTDDRRALSL